MFNTYQTYLKESFDELVTDLEQAERQRFYFGAKLVRGAYIELVKIITFFLYNIQCFLNVLMKYSNYRKEPELPH